MHDDAAVTAPIGDRNEYLVRANINIDFVIIFITNMSGALQVRCAARATKRVFRVVGVSGVRILRVGCACARSIRRAPPQLRAVGRGRAARAARQHAITRPRRPPPASNCRFPAHGYRTHRYTMPSSRYVPAFSII